MDNFLETQLDKSLGYSLFKKLMEYTKWCITLPASRYAATLDIGQTGKLIIVVSAFLLADTTLLGLAPVILLAGIAIGLLAAIFMITPKLVKLIISAISKVS